MSATRLARRPMIIVALAFALMATYLVGAKVGGVRAASSLPADKMTATASTTKVMGPGTDVPVMSAQMKTSTPADLVIQLTSECTILSSITNQGTSTSTYVAKVELWVEIDGHPVPVVPPVSTNGASGSGAASPDNGHVVFCNREFTRTTTFAEGTESIKDVESTEQANAFNWVAMNVGNGVHNIVIKAAFTDTNTADAFAHGVIDKRSLNINTTNYLISQQP
jgi:hypothetical protein